MPDFAGLRAAAEDAVRQPDFATVAHRATRLRRRHHLATGAAAAVMVLLAAVTAGTTLGGAHGQPGALPGTPSPSQKPSVVSVTAADAMHLYAIGSEDCEPSACPADLYASEDGGRTWQSRGELPTDEPDEAWFSIITIGQQTLAGRPWRSLETVSSPSPSVAAGTSRELFPRPTALRVSIDGGRSWRTATLATTPIAAVPDGGAALDCDLTSQMAPCTVAALDPATATVAPLASQPPITVRTVPTLPARAGLWVAGWDPASRRPAVSVSRDAGRTWVTKVFTEAVTVPEVASSGYVTVIGAVPEVASLDGKTAYVTATIDKTTRQVYRTTDGGKDWRPTQAQPDWPIGSFVASDGAYLSAVSENHVTGLEYRASRDGGPFQPVTLDGLAPGSSVPVRPARDGSYFAWDPQHQAIYLSRDGWSYWTAELP